MVKKSYKKRYEELLVKTQVEDKINQHTKNYIHIPFSWSATARFFALLGSVGLAIANFLFLILTWKMLKLGYLDEGDITGINQLYIIFPLLGQYLLIGLVFICLTALIKGKYAILVWFLG